MAAGSSPSSAAFARARSTSGPSTSSPPATARPRSSGAARTPTRRTLRVGLSTTGRSLTGYSTPTASAESGPTPRSGSCPRRFRRSRSPTSTSGARGSNTTSSPRAGPTRPGTTPNGRSWSASGCPTASGDTGAPRSRRGSGRCGTSPTSRPTAHGTPEEFYKLHDYAIDAVRRALPTARVGGADVAGYGGKFMQDFLAHCARGRNYATGLTGTPTDFLSIPR